jgi:hypothetical protein
MFDCEDVKVVTEKRRQIEERRGGGEGRVCNGPYAI